MSVNLPVLAYKAGKDTTIEAVSQLDGSTLWAVRRSGNVLGSGGEWEYEPMPSQRDDAFMARCRFASAQLALAALELAEGKLAVQS